ncbi:MAG: hypothetical protein GY795_21870, partial [Desulfobacterales bacterium]|nr:hypothetical protein [Desulfobacterales bacterium]
MKLTGKMGKTTFAYITIMYFILIFGMCFAVQSKAAGYPDVSTNDINNETDTTVTTADVSGEVTDYGGDSSVVKGVCWNTIGTPLLEKDSYKQAETEKDSFTVTITNLTPNTEYYVRAYASNNIGTSYGKQKSFTTKTDSPTVTTSGLTYLTQTVAIGGGNVVSANGLQVTVRGVCWDTSSEPVVERRHTTDGSGTGSFVSSMTGLSPGTTYYLRAYAENGDGTGYGNEISFTTVSLPKVTTKTVNVINSTSASAGGTVISEGGKSVTERGVCWSTSENPTTADNKTSDGSGTGDYVSSITGLSSGTEYYLRAYAVNEVGTVYGSQVSFSTVTFYVNQYAIGNNDGSSWEDAFPSLKNALDALPTDTYNHEIWVAAGTYKPGTSRSDTFVLKSDLHVYGGFNGTESNRTERDWETNITVLSGDIGTANKISDNCYHVVTASNTNTNTYLNGFTITNGNADGPDTQARGSGMLINNASPNIANCSFIDNSAVEGGGIYNYGGSPTLTDCTFDNNTANLFGGGIYNHNSSPKITNCTFSNNVANSGGGICIDGGTVAVTNCTFSMNSVSGSGGGIYTDSGSLTLTNCTLISNTADSNESGFGYGGGFYIEGADTFAHIKNTIIADNYEGDKNPSPNDCFNENGVNSLGFNLVENGCAPDFSKSSDITGEQASLNISPLADNGGATQTCALVSGSPAIDAGTDYQSPDTDQRGYTRNGPADIGAYEYKGPIILTTSVSSVTKNSAVSGGNVTSDGGMTITARGVCWSESPNPTTKNSHTSDGSGKGSFTSSISSLSSNTVYYVRAYAQNQEGISYGNEISFKTVTDPPIALAATDMATTSLTANWYEAPGAESYRLDVSATGSFTSFVAGYNDLAVEGTSQEITGLISGITYYYRIRAVNSGGASENSAVIAAVTIPPAPEPAPATDITAKSFTANWRAVSNAEGYHLDVSKNDDFTDFVQGYENLSVGAGTSLGITGLTPGVIYHYRVRTVNSSGTSGNSEVTSVQTTSLGPVATDATNKTAHGFTANWKAVDGADDYRIDISLAVDFSDYLSGYENKTVAETFIDITGLSGGTKYYYRIRAVNSGGVSENSNTITVLTVPLPPTVTEPADILAGSFTANWNSSASAVSYRLDVSVSNEFETFVSGYSDKPVGNPSDKIIGLSGSTIYYYRIRAVNGSGMSENSEIQSVKTAPDAPVTAEASDFTATGFTANWNAAEGAEAYRLDVSAANDFSSFAPGYENLTVPSGTSRGVTELTPGTVYYYRVRAVSYVGTSENSNVATALTVPPPPGLLPASQITDSSFTANWDTALSAEKYFLDISVSLEFGSFADGYENLDTGSETIQGIGGLAPGTTYYYRVRAGNASGVSENSFPVKSVVTVPPAPDTEPGTDITTTGFTANWKPTPSAETYRLDVSNHEDFSSYAAESYEDLTVSKISQAVIGLPPGGTYYYRVRAVNSGGTSQNSDTITVTINSVIPEVTTSPVSSVAVSTATGGGEVTYDGGSDILERGVCWSKSENPTVSNSKAEDTTQGTGIFTVHMSGLDPNTTYYVRAYAGNIIGTAYGEQESFMTKDLPTVTTAEVSSATPTTAVSGGTVTNDGGSPVTVRGVCWSTAEEPATDDSDCTSDGEGTGSFTSAITGLSPGVSYNVRAYASTGLGTGYGDTKSFVSVNFPSVTTGSADNITVATASLGGQVTNDGGVPVTVRGVCWNTAGSPDTDNAVCTEEGTGTGSFASSATGLTQDTTYYFKAYAENSVGVSYGDEESFKTLALLVPSVTTDSADDITVATASLGGQVPKDGGVPVTARGVCWNTAGS